MPDKYYAVGRVSSISMEGAKVNFTFKTSIQVPNPKSSDEIWNLLFEKDATSGDLNKTAKLEDSSSPFTSDISMLPLLMRAYEQETEIECYIAKPLNIVSIKVNA